MPDYLLVRYCKVTHDIRKHVQLLKQQEQVIYQAAQHTSILSEVYAALTWVNAQPPHTPQEAAAAIRLLVEPPSEIIVLADSLDTSITMLLLAEKYELTARRVHDARHAATALENGVKKVYTYDTSDWKIFTPEGLSISGPPSVLSKSLQDKSVNE